MYFNQGLVRISDLWKPILRSAYESEAKGAIVDESWVAAAPTAPKLKSGGAATPISPKLTVIKAM